MRQLLLLACLCLLSPAAFGLTLTYVSDDREVLIRNGGVDEGMQSYAAPEDFGPWSLYASGLGAAAQQHSQMDQSGMVGTLAAMVITENYTPRYTIGAAISTFSVTFLTDELSHFNVDVGDLHFRLDNVVSSSGFYTLQPGSHSVIVQAVQSGGSFSILHAPEPATLCSLAVGLAGLAVWRRQGER